ncbi:hypothetical protein BDW62DRAFT_31331 [Aspergillus aurantiobrunneus]
MHPVSAFHLSPSAFLLSTSPSPASANFLFLLVALPILLSLLLLWVFHRPLAAAGVSQDLVPSTGLLRSIFVSPPSFELSTLCLLDTFKLSILPSRSFFAFHLLGSSSVAGP